MTASQILNLVKIDDLITCLYSGIVHHANHSIIFKLHRNVAPYLRYFIADAVLYLADIGQTVAN